MYTGKEQDGRGCENIVVRLSGFEATELVDWVKSVVRERDMSLDAEPQAAQDLVELLSRA